jgi:hypothetical protein
MAKKLPPVVSDYLRSLQAKGAEAIRGTDAAAERARKASAARWGKK